MTDKATIPPDRYPGEGMVWQCGACGKRSEDLYGMIGWHDYGWDESCMLNAVKVSALIEKEKNDG